jgi:hypothetical protein
VDSIVSVAFASCVNVVQRIKPTKYSNFSYKFFSTTDCLWQQNMDYDKDQNQIQIIKMKFLKSVVGYFLLEKNKFQQFRNQWLTYRTNGTIPFTKTGMGMLS